MSCCEGAAVDSKWAEQEAERKAKEAEMMEQSFNLNGVTLKIKDMFPDCWAAKEFVTKMNLLNKCKGGKDLLDSSVSSIMDDEEGEEV